MASRRRAPVRTVDRTDQRAPITDGVVHAAYANPREDVTAIVPRSARTVLDVGCSTGVMGAALAARGHEVTGIEYDPVLAAEARTRLPTVHEADVEAMAAAGTPVEGGPFDCIVFADVLEHLRDPWSVVRWAEPQIATGGSLVVSVPNIRHLETFVALGLRRRWPYKDVGIFDRTHLRFFARENLPDLLGGTDLTIVELTRNRMLKLDPASRWNRVAPYLGDLGTLQFIFRAERPSASGPAVQA